MDALVETVKSEGKDTKAWDVLIQKLDALNSVVTKGSYSDDMARQLEISFNQLKQLVVSLLTVKEPVKATPEVKEPIVTADQLMAKLFTHLKL